MNKVLVFGSLNIDYVYSLDHIVVPGETLSSTAVEKNAGGKGLNQACAIARTGLSVSMAGRIGTDGTFLTGILSSYGVDVSLVDIDSTVPSGNAIIQRSSDGQNSIILFAGTNRTITESMVNSVFSGFGSGDYVVLQNEINNLDLIIRTAKERGMKVVLNPAPFDSSVLSLPLELVDILVVNEIEGAGVCNVEAGADYDALLSGLVAAFPKSEIILTCGSYGAYYGYGSSVVFVPALKVKAVDTTAAGDTFIGYYIASRILGHDVETSMKFATKASSIAVSRKGAAVSVPSSSEVFG